MRFFIIAIAALAGCTTTPSPTNSNVDQIELQLLRAASDASASLNVLAQIRSVEAQRGLSLNQKRELIYEATHIPIGMQKDSIINHGATAPLEEVIEFVAQESNYRTSKRGTPPVEAVIIDIPAGTFPLINILRDAAWQASNEEIEIDVQENARTITIIYPS